MIRTDASHGVWLGGDVVGGLVWATSVVGDRVWSGAIVVVVLRSSTQSHSVGTVTGRQVRGICWQNRIACSISRFVPSVKLNCSLVLVVIKAWMPLQASSAPDEVLAQYCRTF